MLIPEHGFFHVVVEIDGEDDKGNPKKTKEEHLVDGQNLTEVQNKVTEDMQGTIYDWKIIKCVSSKIQKVY